MGRQACRPQDLRHRWPRFGFRPDDEKKASRLDKTKAWGEASGSPLGKRALGVGQ